MRQARARTSTAEKCIMSDSKTAVQLCTHDIACSSKVSCRLQTDSSTDSAPGFLEVSGQVVSGTRCEAVERR